MNSIFLIMIIAFIFIVTFNYVYRAGFIDGRNETFKAYMQEWVEIRQRVSEETWKDLQRAYIVMDERKRKLKKRQNR